MIQLGIDTHANIQIFERDYHGGLLDGDKAKTINICVGSELETTHGRLGFMTVVKIDKHAALEYQQAVSLSRNWLKQELPWIFAKSNYFPFFAYRWLQLPPEAWDLSDAGPLKPLEPLQIESTETMAKCIDEAAMHVASVRAPFDNAKSKLYEYAYNNTAYGFKQTIGEARGLLSKVEQVLACSGEPFGSGSDHARAARRDYEELAKRQVESNRNYQYMLTNLQRFTSMLKFPSIWARKPEAF